MLGDKSSYAQKSRYLIARDTVAIEVIGKLYVTRFLRQRSEQLLVT